MEINQARKVARGLIAAADFARGQLLLAQGQAEDKDTLDVPDFFRPHLDLALFSLVNAGSEYLQCSEAQSFGTLYSNLALARRSLAIALLEQRDDGETMRFTQLQYLADSLRVVNERYSQALLLGVLA